MRIPDTFLKCVVFVGVETDIGAKKEIKWRGTAFVVSLSSTKYKGHTFVYLVTARHVLAEIAGRNFFIRLNTKDGKSVTIEVSGDIKWFYHPDETRSADVAVYPLILKKETFASLDYTTISILDFLTEDLRLTQNIGPGDDIFITGLFTSFSGNEKNLPILRTGNIAMIPDELVPTNKFGNMEVYLIEARSIGGLSGSPVSVIKLIEPGRWRTYLLGLVHGHWTLSDKAAASLPTDRINDVNAGIAIVTPAKVILETIMQPALDKVRTKIEGWHADGQTGTP